MDNNTPLLKAGFLFTGCDCEGNALAMTPGETPENQRPQPYPTTSNPSDKPLLDALTAYTALGRKRFHVPGHGGKALFEASGLTEGIYRYDWTEVEGLDVLSDPEGCLLAAQQAAARAYHVGYSYFLVNGATIGIMAAMLSCLLPGDTVLLPRNVHRSVVNGLVLTGATPVWFYPEHLPEWGLWGGVTPEQITPLLKANPAIKALVVTSPTYEGIGSDIQALADCCRRHGVLLIVDEAHGALWPFHKSLPDSACTLGADVVVQSLHKTAGSLTQTAFAHLPKGSDISPQAFQQALNLLHTTSPSYILMASLDATRAFLASPAGHSAIDNLLQTVQDFRKRFNQSVSDFSLWEPPTVAFWDPTRLVIQHRKVSAEIWAPQLEITGNIAYEAIPAPSALYVATLGLDASDYDAFIQAFVAAEQQLKNTDATVLPQKQSTLQQPLPLPQTALNPREAFFTEGEQVPLKQAVGRIAKETIVSCPPGIPVLIPGEYIQAAHLPFLQKASQVWVSKNAL